YLLLLIIFCIQKVHTIVFTCNARLESFRCSFFNLFSIFIVNLLLSILRPSERMAKSVMPKSIPIDVSVLFIGCNSFSTRMDMKYLYLGFLLKVVLRIRPSTSRLLENLTNPSLGNLILLPIIAILPFVYFVLYDCTLLFLDLKRGALFCFLKNLEKESARFLSDD